MRSRASIWNRPTRIAFAASVWLYLAPAVAQVTPQGTISQDTTWSGQIVISGEVRILGATVRVERGSTVRFGPSEGSARGGSIRLGSTTLGIGRPAKETRLVFAGTADQPITVETAAGAPPGSITTELSAGCSIVARHAIFQRLGSAASGRRGEPAIFLVLSSPEHDLWLTDCRFTGCGRVHAEFIGQGATAEISRCTFTQSAGASAIEWIGTGDGVRVIRDNIADAAVRLECSQVLVRDNVLIGDAAAINVATTSGRAIDITGNYVHCTVGRDEGRYALRCEAADATVAGNVLWGGTYVIERAPRTVTGNVLIGTSGLASDLKSIEFINKTGTTTTHYLLSDPAPHAEISGNLFLGPAYASLAAGRGSTQLRITGNIFDGWNVAQRAVHLNQLSPARSEQPLSATLVGNVFARYRSTPIVDAGHQIRTFAEIGRNLFADVPEMLYELAPGGPRTASGDRRLQAFTDLQFKAPAATRSAMSVDDQLRLRQLTAEAVRRMWFGAYQPLPGSPLSGSRPAGSRTGSSPG